MKRTRWLPIGLLVGALLAAAAAAAAQTDPTVMPIPTPTIETMTPTFAPPTPWISPTPDESGAITIIVAPGESLWVIAARAGLTLAELLALNNLTEADVINPGDVLLVARVTPPAAPTSGTPTVTPPPPTLRPTETRAESGICLEAYDDLDRDGIHDEGEPLRAGVAFTIYNTEAVVANYITDGVSEPHCIAGLLPGEYRVTRSIGPGEVLTTGGDWTLSLTAGSQLRQAFGSVTGAAATAAGPAAGATALPTPANPPAAATSANPPAAATPAPATPAGQTTDAGRFIRLDWRLAGVAILFLGGLLLLAAVLILLFRQPRAVQGGEHRPEPTNERHFRDLDDL